jgi:predicted transcriptional regulator
MMMFRTASVPLTLPTQLQDRHVHHTHLADIPIEMSKEEFDIDWQMTEWKKLNVNRTKINMRLAKAKYTVITTRKETKEILGWKS